MLFNLHTHYLPPGAGIYARSETIHQVATEMVGRLTQDFIDSGAARVEVVPEGDGAWTVIANFRLQP